MSKRAPKSHMWFCFCSPKVLFSSSSLSQIATCKNSTSHHGISHSNGSLCWLFRFLNPGWNLLQSMFFSLHFSWERHNDVQPEKRALLFLQGCGRHQEPLCDGDAAGVRATAVWRGGEDAGPRDATTGQIPSRRTSKFSLLPVYSHLGRWTPWRR